MTLPESLHCEHAQICSGCRWIDLDYHQQRERKHANLTSHLKQAGIANVPEFEWIFIANGGLRDRADLIWERDSGGARLGLYKRDEHRIVHLSSCPQMSNNLQKWFHEFQKFQFPIRKGSLRLRVSPTGKRGVWLDFANEDIKILLEQKTLLLELMNVAYVEVGQRRKKLVMRDGQLKLGAPELFPWFETYVGENFQARPLQCAIGSFTQPGFQANRELVRHLIAMVQSTNASSFLEFGAGIGNFTLPLAQIGPVIACEMDGLACEALKSAAEAANLLSQIEIRRGNFQNLSSDLTRDLSRVEAIVVDPPRSGLLQFIDQIAQVSHRPRNFFYVSCFAETFARDLARLQNFGYRLKRVQILDQFPQSPHYEIIAQLLVA